jgi:hypothetical protein
MAEGRGYRAVIEQMTYNGLGSVDVGLEKDEKKLPARFLSLLPWIRNSEISKSV